MSKKLRLTVTHSFLRLPAVKCRTGLSGSQIYALAAKGNFPMPIKLGGSRASGWLKHEVDQWIEDRIINREIHSKVVA